MRVVGRTLILSAVAGGAAAAEGTSRHARGYVRSAQREVLGVVEVTEQDMMAVPDSIDWSQRGATSAVKNQGDCGSCWAFSTTEGIESAVFMATGNMPDLSTQQIISCDSSDWGCGGGDPSTALNYVEKAGGLDVASDYPDTSHENGNTGQCTWDKEEAAVVTSWSYAIPPCESGKCKTQDEDQLAAALTKYGPLSICVNANYWDPYTSGVFDCGHKNKYCSGAASDLDHCVQLVGFDKSGSSPYWKVRNSWGSDWGEEGFIRLPYGINACGVADEAYVIEAKPSSGSKPQQLKHARGYVKGQRDESRGVLELTDDDLERTPGSIDWSSKGATSAIKNQGDCGSCWAFSTTEGVESAIFMATGKMPELSTQQIISCDSSDYGCNGGDPSTALKYIEQAGGLDTASDYPDKSHTSGNTGKCHWDKQEAAVVTSWKYAIPPCENGQCTKQDEDKLAAALAKHGPLSICVNANYWDPYTSGVFDCGHKNAHCSGAAADLDHCVQLVGYDRTVSSPYWKVRNSWGSSWGESGFIRLPYGINACGVADEAYIIHAALSSGTSVIV